MLFRRFDYLVDFLEGILHFEDVYEGRSGSMCNLFVLYNICRFAWLNEGYMEKDLLKLVGFERRQGVVLGTGYRWVFVE